MATYTTDIIRTHATNNIANTITTINNNARSVFLLSFILRQTLHLEIVIWKTNFYRKSPSTLLFPILHVLLSRILIYYGLPLVCFRHSEINHETRTAPREQKKVSFPALSPLPAPPQPHNHKPHTTLPAEHQNITDITCCMALTDCHWPSISCPTRGDKVVIARFSFTPAGFVVRDEGRLTGVLVVGCQGGLVALKVRQGRWRTDTLSVWCFVSVERGGGAGWKNVQLRLLFFEAYYLWI